jgi:O-antigen/teichoic acid export membrane protein
VGVEGYGVITFYSVLMSLMHFADAGLSGTLTREFAREEPYSGYKRDFLKTFETVYLGIAIIVFVVIFFFSGFIVDHFLKSNIIPHSDLVICVKLMAIIMAFHFMSTLYEGGLIGLQKQILEGSLNIGYSILRGVVVLIPLMFCPNVNVFIAWQLLSMIVLFIVKRICLVRIINVKNERAFFRFDYLKNVWRYALGLFIMAIVAALNTQLDKLVTGNLLSLESLGYYSIAGTLGAAVLTIANALCTAFYPELTRLVSVGDRIQIIKPFLLFSFIVSLVTSAIGISVFFYCDDLLSIWTRDIAIVEHATIPAMILVLGNIAVSLQYSTYYLAMANGHTKTNIILSSCSLLLMAPSVYILTKLFGLNATPIPYLVINSIATVLMAIILINKFLKGTLKQWFVDSFLPVIVSFLIVAPTSFIVKRFCDNSFVRILFACIIGIICLYVITIFYLRKHPESKTSKVVSKFIKYIPTKWIEKNQS